MPLGPMGITERGFEKIEFTDRYGLLCSLQMSSLAEQETPGTSAVWLGVHDIHPGARGTRMHLDRKQVLALIEHLESWLKYDSFEIGEGY